MTDKPTLDTAKLAVLDEIHTESTPKAPRATHTPAERATAAVDVLQRRLAKLTTNKAALELQALELEPQIESMQKRLDYALSNPDLPDAKFFEALPKPEVKALVEPGIVAEVVAEEARRDALQQPSPTSSGAQNVSDTLRRH